ncbi:MAG: UDP-2,3-diacylglucosamine diphosphatase LpxI [Pseudomonadota bacterium]
MSKNLAIIAGRGLLPRELANGASRSGQKPFLIGIEDEVEPWLSEFDHEILGWGQFGKLFSVLEQRNIGQVVLAGSVTRPKIKIAKMDWGAIRSLPQVLAFMIGGDNSLLSGVINLFESRGIEVVGAHEILPDLLVEKGPIVGRTPPKKALTNISKAVEAAKELGRLDIGQAAVAVGGRVVAVEGIEGTDGMLERVELMRRNGRLFENGRYGVLVKTMKPDQEMRVDLPAIGPDTINRLAEAGLRGVGVEAGQSFILDREKTLKLARFHEVFIYGLDPGNGVS